MDRSFAWILACGGAFAAAAACSSSSGSPGTQPAEDAGADAASDSPAGPVTTSAIAHVVVIIQENHTFDDHFGHYCTAATGSSPTCTSGPACCEAGPATDPGGGGAPTTLTDKLNGLRDPHHDKACELGEIHGGAMDMFVKDPACGNAGNFVYADDATMKPLWDLAATGAMGDRYFQSIAGASSSNDMYFARAQWVFDDNSEPKGAVGTSCNPFIGGSSAAYPGPTLGDLLTAAGVAWTSYAEGYDVVKTAVASGVCPSAPADCPDHLATYPCIFDPGDIPFEYYDATRDVPAHMADFTQLTTDLAAGTLPAVSLVKAIGYKSEHPGGGTILSAGLSFVTSTVSAILASSAGPSTLVIVTYDEGGGFFDHVKPPDESAVDHQPYGTRVPFLVLGPFAKPNEISHVQLEPSSVVKLIEWNWLGGATGQLAGRDATAANLGSVLDGSKTGTAVPEK